MSPAGDWLRGQARVARSAVRWASLPVEAWRHERRPGVVILLYHRVGGETRSDVDVSARTFERQMRYLKRHCLVVSLDEVVRFAARRTVRHASRDVVAITFDDGYRETYELAYPIMRRFGLPATIYLPSMYVEEQQPFDFGGFQRARTDERPRPMTWEMAGEMLQSGLVTIGGHTLTHADLSRADAGQAAREIDECDRLIERRLGIVPRHFAYPWGRWSVETQQVVAARYETVVLGGPAKNPYVDMDLTRMWRYPVLRTDGFWLFRARMHLLGAGGALPGLGVPDGVEARSRAGYGGGAMS